MNKMYWKELIFVAYNIIHVYPDISDEERERRKQEAARVIYEVFKAHEEKEQKEKKAT